MNEESFGEKFFCGQQEDFCKMISSFRTQNGFSKFLQNLLNIKYPFNHITKKSFFALPPHHLENVYVHFYCRTFRKILICEKQLKM